MLRQNYFRHVKATFRRSFHTAKNSSNQLLEADSSKGLNKAYHASGLILAVLTPVALAVSPSPVTLPFDLLLGALFPLHSHVALNYVISDYVPKVSRPAARGVILVATVIAAAGILQINLAGPGLTETIKSLWRPPKTSDKK